jgi:hypothetical protein
VGSAGGQEGGAQGLRCSTRRRPPGLDHAVGLFLRRSLSRGVPRPDPRQGRSSCSPTRPRSSRSTRSTASTRRSPRRGPRTRSAR